MQYDEEKKQNLPLSEHFKELKTAKGFLVSEIGFIDVILYPLFETANEFSEGEVEEIVKNIRQTRTGYAEKLESVEAGNKEITGSQ